MNTLAHNPLPINVRLSGHTDRNPSVSIIQSFQPKMAAKSEIDYGLKLAAGKVEKELLAHYPADKALPVIEHLRHILKNLNYYTHKTSVAIFASPGEEKVVYLDMPVNNKVVIDDSFCMRDIICCKKQDARYLVLQLSTTASKTWVEKGDSLQLIKSNRAADAGDTNTFLQHMEQGLALLLKSYPLPVFILGPRHLTGCFADLTHHAAHIAAYIHEDLPQAGEAQLLTVLQPYVSDWQQVKQQTTLQQVENALQTGRLIQGVDAILSAASRNNNHLLVVEKDFSAPESAHSVSVDTPFYIRDTVDTIIQKVLEAGTDVEFVDNGALQTFGHMALVQYY